MGAIQVYSVLRRALIAGEGQDSGPSIKMRPRAILAGVFGVSLLPNYAQSFMCCIGV